MGWLAPILQYGEAIVTATNISIAAHPTTGHTYETVAISDQAQAIVGNVYHTHHHNSASAPNEVIDVGADRQQAFTSDVMAAAKRYGIQQPGVPVPKEKADVAQWVGDVIESNVYATTIWDGESDAKAPSLGTSLAYMDQNKASDEVLNSSHQSQCAEYICNMNLTSLITPRGSVENEREVLNEAYAIFVKGTRVLTRHLGYLDKWPGLEAHIRSAPVISSLQYISGEDNLVHTGSSVVMSSDAAPDNKLTILCQPSILRDKSRFTSLKIDARSAVLSSHFGINVVYQDLFVSLIISSNIKYVDLIARINIRIKLVKDAHIEGQVLVLHHYRNDGEFSLVDSDVSILHALLDFQKTRENWSDPLWLYAYNSESSSTTQNQSTQIYPISSLPMYLWHQQTIR